jgi:hypothetical protein
MSEPSIDAATGPIATEDDVRVVVEPIPAYGEVQLRVTPEIAEDLLTRLRAHGVDSSRALEHSAATDLAVLSIIGGSLPGLAKVLKSIAEIRTAGRISVEVRDGEWKVDNIAAREIRTLMEEIAELPNVDVQPIDLPTIGHESDGTAGSES